MKKLKKIKLTKEAVVNLNDYEMQQIQGGSSMPCVETILSAYEISQIIYSYINCDNNGGNNGGNDLDTTISEQHFWYNGEQSCLFPDIYAYGLDTSY